MKKLLPLLVLILIGCSSGIEYDDLDQRNGVYYRKDTNEIYSGPVISYHPNGQINYEGTYKDGKRDGPYKYYFENGLLYYEETYKNGEQISSKSTSFDYLDKEWKVISEETRKDGKMVSEKKFNYYKNGQLKQEGTYKDGNPYELKDGILDGPYKTYHKNGQLKEETTYKDGEKDGPYKTYHKNGQLKLEGTYKDGEKDGSWKRYHEYGRLLSEDIYKDGYYSNTE